MNSLWSNSMPISAEIATRFEGSDSNCTGVIVFGVTDTGGIVFKLYRSLYIRFKYFNHGPPVCQERQLCFSGAAPEIFQFMLYKATLYSNDIFQIIYTMNR